MKELKVNEIQIKIKNLISENINMIDFQIIDESHKHANHKKDDTSKCFAGDLWPAFIFSKRKVSKRAT